MGMGREARLNKNLTRKQVIFINGVIQGRSATQAALEAYNTNDPKVASVIASENLTKPNIREALEEVLSSNGLTPSLITSNLGTLANSKPEKISGEVKLKANIELLKLMGAYPGSKSVQVSYSIKDRVRGMSYQEIKVELEKVDNEANELLDGTPTPT